MQAGLAATAGWLVRNQIAMREDIAVFKYYMERQTADAATRLDKGNPAPAEIIDLVHMHIDNVAMSTEQKDTLIKWLRWTGTGKNPDADSSEISAALALLTGVRTRERFENRWFRRLWGKARQLVQRFA